MVEAPCRSPTGGNPGGCVRDTTLHPQNIRAAFHPPARDQTRFASDFYLEESRCQAGPVNVSRARRLAGLSFIRAAQEPLPTAGRAVRETGIRSRRARCEFAGDCGAAALVESLSAWEWRAHSASPLPAFLFLRQRPPRLSAARGGDAGGPRARA